jgi:gliding motility-associated peptidyl-prolyl isomerase
MNRILIILLLAFSAFSCKTPEAREPRSVKSGSFIKDSAERNKKLIQKEHDLIKKKINNDPNNDYIASKSGFWYYYNTKVEQDTLTPQFGDIVNFDYSIKDFNNQVIYSDDDIKPTNYVMDKEELFTGLREGLKLMKPGETVTFLFPSQKAYGYYGDTNRIGMNTPLICKVTLYSTIKNQND